MTNGGKSCFVYVTNIRTTPEKHWSALIDPAFMKLYWFGCHCERWDRRGNWCIPTVRPSNPAISLRANRRSAW